jgi:hypothetical protein
MQTKTPKTPASYQISFLMPTLGEQLDPRQPLKQLADTIPWSEFEQAFGKQSFLKRAFQERLSDVEGKDWFRGKFGPSMPVALLLPAFPLLLMNSKETRPTPFASVILCRLRVPSIPPARVV